MKNKFYSLLIIFIISILFITKVNSDDIFSFNISELQITEEGNLIQGYNGGEAYTEDGVSIKAENFEFNKTTNILIANQNVLFNDKNKNITISAKEILYEKNNEKIIATGNVSINDKYQNVNIKANKVIYYKNKNKISAVDNVNYFDVNKNIIITAEEITYFKEQQKLFAKNNVKLNDLNKKIKINTDEITYLKNESKFFTIGNTFADIKSKYEFKSKNVFFLQDEMKLFSSEKTIIKDLNNTIFELGSFDYNIKDEYLKGSKVTIIENSNLTSSERNKFYFENGFFDLKNEDFITGLTKMHLKKNLFDRSENDPRIYGASSSRKNQITTINKAVFTSCKKSDKCPPWRLEASEIKHDKNKKKIIYENTILKVYDLPVFYFPKFFHPDPTVNRQSGFLTPKFNNSNILGTSLSMPYFHVISGNKDLTINPILFSKDINLFQNEYRQENERSSFIADFGITHGYKSTEVGEEKKINHIFAEFKKKLNLKNFITSDFKMLIQRTNKDTYLKIFSDSLEESMIKPQNSDILNSGFNFLLEHKNYSINAGADVFEDLRKLQSDRYQFVFPYYNYIYKNQSTSLGTYNFASKGNNILDNTNNIKSRIINDFSFNFNDKIFDNIGLKNNLGLHLKNLNSLGKNDKQYKSSPQLELQSLLELRSDLPLIKISENNSHTLIPKLSIRINPSDMKDHSSDERRINTSNIFDLNRFGIDDSFESGYSTTLGIDYNSKNLSDDQNYLELKLATVIRNDNESKIPTQTSLNKKNSNLFGSMDYKISELINIDYDFAMDNHYENFEYNSFGIDLSMNNFVTSFNFLEENNDSGSANVLENKTIFNINNQNSLSFKTRRNRKINLTEYYDLVYEYKNDCLTAGIQFNKTYYEDRDLKPSENIMFRISFYPLTSIEQPIDLFN